MLKFHAIFKKCYSLDSIYFYTQLVFVFLLWKKSYVTNNLDYLQKLIACIIKIISWNLYTQLERKGKNIICHQWLTHFLFIFLVKLFEGTKKCVALRLYKIHFAKIQVFFIILISNNEEEKSHCSDSTLVQCIQFPINHFVFCYQCSVLNSAQKTMCHGPVFLIKITFAIKWLPI